MSAERSAVAAVLEPEPLLNNNPSLAAITNVVCRPVRGHYGHRAGRSLRATHQPSHSVQQSTRQHASLEGVSRLLPDERRGGS